MKVHFGKGHDIAYCLKSFGRFLETSSKDGRKICLDGLDFSVHLASDPFLPYDQKNWADNLYFHLDGPVPYFFTRENVLDAISECKRKMVAFSEERKEFAEKEKRFIDVCRRNHRKAIERGYSTVKDWEKKMVRSETAVTEAEWQVGVIGWYLKYLEAGLTHFCVGYEWVDEYDDRLDKLIAKPKIFVVPVHDGISKNRVFFFTLDGFVEGDIGTLKNKFYYPVD